MRPSAAVLLLATLLLILFSHPLVHGDGLAHFIYLDSIAGDGDLDLRNQQERFAAANTYHIFPNPATGELVTSFPFGTALLLAPFYWLGRVLNALPALHAHPDHFYLRQGLPLAFSLSAALGALLYTLAAVWLAYQSARRVAPAWAAALAVLSCLAGTPLLFYATVEPLSSHAYGAFLLALALWLGIKIAEQPNDGRELVVRALALGLVLGMALLVRWQLLLYALPVAVVWIATAAWRIPPRAPLLPGAAFALGLGLFVALCCLYFWRFFGSPFVIPNEAQVNRPFIGLPLRHIVAVLFDASHGWLPWSPLVALGVLGLVLLLWAGPRPWRMVSLACLGGIGLQLALNSSLHDWLGGWAFGQRRMTEAYPALTLGLAWLLGRRGRMRALLLALTLAGAFYGLLVFCAHLYYTHAAPHPEGGSVGTSLAWLLNPANWSHALAIFADRYGPWAWARPEL